MIRSGSTFELAAYFGCETSWLISNDNITQIAFKCGYENQSSFNKAFKVHFLYTPSQIRKQKLSIDTFKINLDINRDIEMKPEIIKVEDIKLICARETVL